MFTAYEKYTCMQRAKKVVSDSPGLVDFAIGLVNSVFKKNCEINSASQKVFGATVKMTFGLVNSSFSLPEWQAVKMIFFAPCVCIACHYQNGINYAKDSS